MSLFDDQIKPDAVPLPSVTGTLGPQTGFLDNFKASYAEQSHVRAAFGLDQDFADMEQKNLDKIFEMTGERIAPVAVGSWSGTQDPTNSVLHGLAGDQLNAAQQDMFNTSRLQMDRVAELSKKYPGVMNYDQMFQQLRDKAQQYVDTSGDQYGRSTFMGALGGFAGGAFGSMVPDRDPLNFASLGLGGVGKTFIAKIVSEMGVNALSQAVELATGSYEKQKLLNQTPTAEEMAVQVAAAGLGAGAIRAAGEGVAAGFRSLVGRFGARAPDVAAAALSKEVENAIGPSPYGTSRAAQGLHTAEVIDALQRDAPLNLPGMKFADPAMTTSSLAGRDSDALFAGTSEPLSRIFTNLPGDGKASDIVNANKTLSMFTERLGKIDQRIAELDTNASAQQTNATSPAELDRLRARAADLDSTITSSTMDARTIGGLKRDKARLEEAIGRAEAVNNDLTAMAAERTRVSEVGESLRIARAQMVADVANGAKGTNARTAAPQIVNGVGGEKPRPIDVKPGTQSQSAAIEKSLTEKPSEPAEAPKVRVIAPPKPEEGAAVEAAPKPPAGEAGSGETAELGQRSGAVDLDTPVVHGFDEEGNPITATVREILQAHKDDDALVSSMKSCLLA